MAAIGASTTAKRLGVVYSLFKVIAVPIAMVSFPVWRDAAGGFPHGVQRRRRLGPRSGDRLVYAIRRNALGPLRLGHRSATLATVATGELTADDAIARVDAVIRLEALARQAWRSAAHLGAGGE
jgi:phosphate:Na+ symporter